MKIKYLSSFCNTLSHWKTRMRRTTLLGIYVQSNEST